MQRVLAVLLVLIGLIGLGLGRLGETVWAPATKTTATVELTDPGPAVVIDPGVLYVGAEEGELVIEGASDLSVITAANSDIDAYLEGVRHTRITGASDWTTLSTETVEGETTELSAPTDSDLWRTVDTAASPYTLDIGEFWAGENGENEQVYRALLIVTDGTAPGADSLSITWPVDAENEWVNYAYAGGAAIAVIGLVLLVVSISGRRRDQDEAVGTGPADPADGATGTAVAADGAERPADDPDDAAVEADDADDATDAWASPDDTPTEEQSPVTDEEQR